MPFDFSTDDDRAEWDRIWRNRPLRQLVNPVQIDVAPSPDHEFGELTRVDVAADPPQFADRGNRATETCPVCGVTTSPELRIAVSIYPYFASGFSYGRGAWAHEACLASCREIPGPAPVPW